MTGSWVGWWVTAHRYLEARISAEGGVPGAGHLGGGQAHSGRSLPRVVGSACDPHRRTSTPHTGLLPATPSVPMSHVWGRRGRGGREGAGEGRVQRREQGGERTRGGLSPNTVASFGGLLAVRQVQTPGQSGGIHLCLRDGSVKAWG